MPRVLVVPASMRTMASRHREILASAGFDILLPDSETALLDRRVLLDHLAGVDAVIAGAEKYDADVFSATPLRVVARFGVGYDAVDVPAATSFNIPVTITPGANEDSVAEHVLSLLLAVYRDLFARHASVVSGAFVRQPGIRLHGKTLGLVGLGRIGRALAWRASALGMRVLAHDPCADREFAARHGIELLPLSDLLAQSDAVSLHLPCTSATTHLINAETLALMKPSALLINTSRGGLVDESALFTALSTGRIAAAGLDVFEQEPLPAHSPLASLPNVILSPHVAGWDHDSLIAMAERSAQCVVDLYQGRWPTGSVVNDELRAGWNWRASRQPPNPA